MVLPLARRNSCKMNKETGEVNEIFKLDFFPRFFLLLSAFAAASFVRPGKIMVVIFSTLGHGARLIGKVGGVYIFSLAFFLPFSVVRTSSSSSSVMLTKIYLCYASYTAAPPPLPNRDNRNFIVRKDNEGVFAERTYRRHRRSITIIL